MHRQRHQRRVDENVRNDVAGQRRAEQKLPVHAPFERDVVPGLLGLLPGQGVRADADHLAGEIAFPALDLHEIERARHDRRALFEPVEVLVQSDAADAALLHQRRALSAAAGVAELLKVPVGAFLLQVPIGLVPMQVRARQPATEHPARKAHVRDCPLTVFAQTHALRGLREQHACGHVEERLHAFEIPHRGELEPVGHARAHVVVLVGGEEGARQHERHLRLRLGEVLAAVREEHRGQVDVRIVRLRFRHQCVLLRDAPHQLLVVARRDVGIGEPRRVADDCIEHLVHEHRLVDVLQHELPDAVAPSLLGPAHGAVHGVQLGHVLVAEWRRMQPVSQCLSESPERHIALQLTLDEVLRELDGLRKAGRLADEGLHVERQLLVVHPHQKVMPGGVERLAPFVLREEQGVGEIDIQGDGPRRACHALPERQKQRGLGDLHRERVHVDALDLVGDLLRRDIGPLPFHPRHHGSQE